MMMTFSFFSGNADIVFFLEKKNQMNSPKLVACTRDVLIKPHEYQACALGMSSHTPCKDEFMELIKCLTTTSYFKTGCHAKYVVLKSCLHAHGLNFDSNSDK